MSKTTYYELLNYILPIPKLLIAKFFQYLHLESHAGSLMNAIGVYKAWLVLILNEAATTGVELLRLV